MRKLAIAGILAVGGFLFVSCTEKEIQTEEPVKTYTLSLQLGGEILDVTYSDLTKGEDDKDLYGFQVYSRVSGDTGYYSNYAYGLFDTLEGLTITLIDGYEYTFHATLIKDGKDRLSQTYDGRFGTPFGICVGTAFIYSTETLLSLNQGAVSLQGEGGYSYIRHPNIDRYYGELSGFVPGESDIVTIEMKRMVFGLRVIANGMTEGKLKIQMQDAPVQVIVNPDTELEEVFSLMSLYSALITENYKESITVSFTWVKDNEEEVLLASRPFDFYRKKWTTITVKVQDHSLTPAVGVTLEDGTLEEGDTYDI